MTTAVAPSAGAGSRIPLVRVALLGRPVAARLALAVVAGSLASGAAIGLTATSAWLISKAAEQPPVLDLMVAITAVRFFGISRGVFRYAERLTSHDAAFRVLGRVRGRVYERLEKLAPAGLAEFRSGDLLARLVDDIDGLADIWLRVLLPYLMAGVTAAAAVTLLWYLVPAAGIVLAVSLLLVAFVVPVLSAAVARKAERRIAAVRGQLAAETLEVLAGAQELLVAGATEDRLDCLGEIDSRLAAGESRTSAGIGLGGLLSGLAGGAAVWIGLLAGIAAVRAGSLGGVALAVVVLTPLAVHESVMGLSAAAQHVPGLAAMASRITDVISRPDPVREPATPERLPSGPYGIRARGLRARYPQPAAPERPPEAATRPQAAGGGPEAPPALAMPDIEIGPGERLLVTGPSGSGKTTFAAVLVRFIDPSAGSIELVGRDRSVDLRNLSGDDVRSVICLCEQDPHVFNSTILENVRLARPEATEDEIRLALSRAQLSGWVDSLPDGLETLVGEHGARLSGGQRQRLALARTLLADAPVVVFDEPTEHVDEATAITLTADLLAATAGTTVVMITHRPELIASTGWTARVELASPAPDEGVREPD